MHLTLIREIKKNHLQINTCKLTTCAKNVYLKRFFSLSNERKEHYVLIHNRAIADIWMVHHSFCLNEGDPLIYHYFTIFNLINFD